MKSSAFLVTLFVFCFGMAALFWKADTVLGGLFFVPMALGPLFVSLWLAAISPSQGCQRTLIIGSLLYAAWFGYVFLDVFVWHVDPQSAIALMFIGLVSLVVMVPLWIVTLVLRSRSKGQAS
ncbi:MAG: hypothetical protein ACOYOF_16920 [Verrucomicrobiaceae bacterium]